MKAFPKIILFASFIGLASLLFGCSEESQREEEHKVSVKFQNEKEALINFKLVEKYDAVRDWDLVLTQSREKTTKSHK